NILSLPRPTSSLAPRLKTSTMNQQPPAASELANLDECLSSDVLCQPFGSSANLQFFAIGCGLAQGVPGRLTDVCETIACRLPIDEFRATKLVDQLADFRRTRFCRL